MKKTINFYILTAISLIAVSCGQPTKQGQQQGQALPVTTTNVTKTSAVYFDKYPATAMALRKVDLRSEVSGYIRRIAFEEGTEVKKGQLLYTIDQSKYVAAKNQAVANLEAAKANLKQAKQDADRYTALAEKDAIAKQTVDAAQTSLENARQQVAVAEANLDHAQTDLNYSTIEAPFDGMIGISDVRLGAYVVAGQTLLNTISSSDPMGVDIEISQTELSRYTQLKQQHDVVSDSAIYLMLPDGTKYKHHGKIAIIDRGVNAQTGTLTVRLSFENPDDKLRDGMSVMVHVRNTGSGENLLIPYKAVVEQMGEYFVFSVKEGKAQQVKVKTGKQLGDEIIINDGLTEGQTIVIEGIQRLRNGMPVQATAANQSAEPTQTAAAAE